MKTLTFNKDNWTGEVATMHVHADGIVELDGEQGTYEQEVESGEGYTLYLLTLNMDGIEVRAARFESGGGDTEEYIANAFGVSRGDTNPFIAAAQVLFNI